MSKYVLVDTTQYNVVEKEESKFNRLYSELKDMEQAFNELAEYTGFMIDNMKILRQEILSKRGELSKM